MGETFEEMMAEVVSRATIRAVVGLAVEEVAAELERLLAQRAVELLNDLIATAGDVEGGYTAVLDDEVARLWAQRLVERGVARVGPVARRLFAEARDELARTGGVRPRI